MRNRNVVLERAQQWKAPLLLQRLQVLFPVSTLWLTTIGNSNSRRSNILFWPPGHQDICGTQIGKTLIPIKQLNLKKHKFLKRTFKKTETLIWASIKVGSKVTKNIRERSMELEGLRNHTFRKPRAQHCTEDFTCVPHLVLASWPTSSLLYTWENQAGQSLPGQLG